MTSLSTLLFISTNHRAESKTSLNNICIDTNTNLNDQTEEDTRLSLAYEHLNSIPKSLLHRFSPIIRTLDISHNEFENVNFLKELIHLTTLICDNNSINSNTEFPYLPNLQILWINHCKINELYPWIKNLQNSCFNLRQLSMMGNPAAPSYLNGGTFYEYLQYRLFVISLFPKLEHLDDRAVTEEQRQESYRMYRRPLLERIRNGNTINSCIRNVSDKVLDFFQPIPNFAVQTKNLII